MITGKNLVGGVWESSATEVVFQTVNPNTKEKGSVVLEGLSDFFA